MRYITIPDDVILMDPGNPEQRATEAKQLPEGRGYSIKEIPPQSCGHVVITEIVPLIKTDLLENIWNACKITEAFRNVRPGDVVKLDDDVYKTLVNVIRNPPVPLFGGLMLRAVAFRPFLLAIDHAADREPVADAECVKELKE